MKLTLVSKTNHVNVRNAGAPCTTSLQNKTPFVIWSMCSQRTCYAYKPRGLKFWAAPGCPHRVLRGSRHLRDAHQSGPSWTDGMNWPLQCMCESIIREIYNTSFSSLD